MKRPLTTLLTCLAMLTAQPAASVEPVKPVLDAYKHRQLLVGRWLMSRRTADGGEATWLVERNDGGTYRRQMRVAQIDGKVTQSEDVGQWGVVNRVLFTMTRVALARGNRLLTAPARPTLTATMPLRLHACLTRNWNCYRNTPVTALSNGGLAKTLNCQ